MRCRHMPKRCLFLTQQCWLPLAVLLIAGGVLLAGIAPVSGAPASAARGTATTAPTTQELRRLVGEKVPSEDPQVPNFHSLGLVNGTLNIFRCGSPVRNLANTQAAIQDSSTALPAAKERMKHLYDLGIRTLICLEHPLQDKNKEGSSGAAQIERSMALEKASAAEVGITFLAIPMSNSGKDSMEDMSDEAVFKQLDMVTDEIFKDAGKGGVAFHCTAGKDRTGIVAGYIRLKYQHWPIDQVIAEMRRYGHEFVGFSRNGGISSWHEEHLTVFANSLKKP